MAAVRRRYPPEEFARRGQEIYDRDVRPGVTGSDKGKFAAVDIESGIYEIDEDDWLATERVRERNPLAQIWLVRIGHRATYDMF